MIVVHHLNESRSQRVLWLLEELDLPYEIRHYERDAKTRLAPPELKAVHPLGKSPVVEADGMMLIESGGRARPARELPGHGRLGASIPAAACLPACAGARRAVFDG